MSGDEVAFDLLREVEGHADDDHQRGTAEIERHVPASLKQGRNGHDRSDVESAANRDTRENRVDILGGRLTGPHTWNERAGYGSRSR